jgi:[ribosomal protein S18]-alanine N-acetyltransferase
MTLTIRLYQPEDFSALHKLDQVCFPPGISYSKFMLQYFLALPESTCMVAEEGNRLLAFILAETTPPESHIITLDVAPTARRTGAGSQLLQKMENFYASQSIETVLIETAVDNAPAIAFWHHHGYRTEAVIKRYYLGRIDAYEMRKRLPAEPGESA